jgi:hypothetical protein
MPVWYASFLPVLRYVVNNVSDPFQYSTLGLPVLCLYMLCQLLVKPEHAVAGAMVSHVSRVSH